MEKRFLCVGLVGFVISLSSCVVTQTQEKATRLKVDSCIEPHEDEVKTESASPSAPTEKVIPSAAVPLGHKVISPVIEDAKREDASYFKQIEDRISLYWFLGYGTRTDIKLETEDDKPIVIEFKVLPDGSIDSVKIKDAAGNSQLASELVASINKASPLNPFPSNIKEPSIEVRFNFYFSDFYFFDQKESDAYHREAPRILKFDLLPYHREVVPYREVPFH